MTDRPAGSAATEVSRAEARHFARETVKRSGTSFFHAMRILPRPRREAMYAVYAYCRTIDDVADGLAPLEQKVAALTDWREEIARLYAGHPTRVVTRALEEPIALFALPRQEFELLIEGMETDVSGRMRAPTMDELLRYTRRVAGTVGLLSMRVFGAPCNEAADSFALDLADALQLTNILRDVREDASAGRLYLPRDLLLAHDIRSTAPDEVVRAPGLEHVCRDLAAFARRRFAKVRRALEHLDPAPLRPALMMMGIYETYLDRLEHTGFDRHAPRVKLSRLEMFAVSARYALALPPNP